MESVADNLKHPTEDIVKSAVAAVHAMSRVYFGRMPAAWQGDVVRQYLSKLDDSNPAARRESICVAGCCRVLQGIAVCCSMLQRVVCAMCDIRTSKYANIHICMYTYIYV